METVESLQHGLDPHRASLFDLLAEQQLSSLIPPSLRYLLAQATHRHPRYLLRILNSFDELYALLSLFIERYYLHTFSSSFTENFYSLKRERVLRTGNGELPRASRAAPDQVRDALRLRDWDIWKNLAVLVALPYLKRKLDESYDIHASAHQVLGPTAMYPVSERITAESTLPQRVMCFYKWFLKRIYPSVNAAYYFTLLAWNMAYLVNGSKYSSPFLWAVGTRIRIMSGADHRAVSLAGAATASSAPRPGNRPGANSVFSPRVLMVAMYNRLLGSLRLALPASIFALKLLEWWHASDFARQLSRRAREGVQLPVPTISALDARIKVDVTKRQSGVTMPSTDDEKLNHAARPEETVEAPARPQVSASTGLPIFTVALAKDTGACPICRQQITIPTVSPYGYVYCYTCIFRWVDGTHDLQEGFMKGSDHEGPRMSSRVGDGLEMEVLEDRTGRWENGIGRCAVSGKQVLGGTSGLRRVMV